MKTLLIPTDFSANAKHAVEYGYNLAKQIKANVMLCNAVIVPAEMPQAGFVIWPMEEYDVLMDDSADELKKLKDDDLQKQLTAMEMSRAGMISRLTSSGKSFEVMCPCTTNSFVVGVLTGGNAGEWML